MGTREELIDLLADGTLQSGENLARTLNCSRTAVWKQLHQLTSLGLDIDAVPGQGYKLCRSVELLSRDLILKSLAPDVADQIDSLALYSVTDSTSDRLRDSPSPDPGRMRVALAEYQTGGRGRRGRNWLSPFGSGLCLSVSWCFTVTPPDMPALGLAAGVAIMRALAPINAASLGLKWPNDIVANGKLGGLLVEVQGESEGPITAIVGVGMNVDVSDKLMAEVTEENGLPPVGLRELVPDRIISRNDLAARIIVQLHAALLAFNENGFARFSNEWRDFDRLIGKPITVQIGSEALTGVARGIADNGALLLETKGQVRPVISGEVTVTHSASG